MKTEESICPLCETLGNRYHSNPERLLVCDDCQKVLMPELSDEEYEFDHPSVNDAGGYVHEF